MLLLSVYILVFLLLSGLLAMLDAAVLSVTLAETEEFEKRRSLLTAAMETLNQRERHILEERRLKDGPTTLEELSQEYGISRERVRQIEVRAFEKLQKAIRNAAIEERLAVN